MMEVTLVDNGRGVIAKDKLGNELWYYYEGKALRAVCATFNGCEYTMDGLRWKRDKRGAVSAAFTLWYDAIHDKAYKLHFGLE